MPQHAADADEVAAVLVQVQELVVAVAVELTLIGILDLVRPRKKVVAGGVVDRPPRGHQQYKGQQCSGRSRLSLTHSRHQ
jgi:hypothetical protein